jgi:hypothetical protein
MRKFILVCCIALSITSCKKNDSSNNSLLVNWTTTCSCPPYQLDIRTNNMIVISGKDSVDWPYYVRNDSTFIGNILALPPFTPYGFAPITFSVNSQLMNVNYFAFEENCAPDSCLNSNYNFQRQ